MLAGNITLIIESSCIFTMPKSLVLLWEFIHASNYYEIITVGRLRIYKKWVLVYFKTETDETYHILVNFKANQVSYNTYAHTFCTSSDYKN